MKSAESSFLVFTKTYLVSNLGRKPASGVELTFGFRPDNFSLWPQRNYAEALNKDGCLTLKFDGIAPREQFTISMLTVRAEPPNLLSLRSQESAGKEIPIAPMRIFGRPVIIAFFVLVFLGLCTAFYILILSIGLFARLSGVNA
jgi:hypothetical protein